MSGQASEKAPSSAAEASHQTKPSNDGSPVRNPRSVSAIPQLSRSRKNSQEFSPNRSTVTNGPSSTVPSAAAVQRALSAQRPILPPSGLDGVVESTRGSERQLKPGGTTPAWPTSPRLKSPPSNNSGARASTKRSDSEPTPSNTSLRRLATASNPDQAAAMQIPENQELSFSHSSLRVPARGPSAAGALETVAESSVPTTPSIGPVQSAHIDSKIEVPSLNQRTEVRNEASTAKDGEGSGGDTSSKPSISKGDNGRRSRAASNSRPPSELAKRSLPSLTGAKTKTSTDPPRTMTVETETVASVPQLLGPDRGISGRDGNGSVRTKPSNETIRPKKEKKRSSRKPPSLHAGTVTSKADLFEAKVASAVDEADSSDSDETFVYESNPPDSRPSRHHSRTPSATSLASQEQPNSPRIPNGRSPATPRKGESFDPYDDAADDERAPLIGSVRINRNRHSRRPHSASFRNLDYDEAYDRNYCGRFGGCIFLGFIVLLICVGITTFVMALNRPLLDISIKRIQNVLASDQELMLDLNVEAVNPNLFTITVNDLDINLFAESAYVNTRPDDGGTFRWITRRASSSLGFNWPPWDSKDGVDEGTDPIDEPEPGTQKMLLGRILEFDSPLLFEASPVRRTRTSSVGEIRLARPGNKTEEGGSARWEKVLQHQFDLIVRGVIKYQLPLSSKTRSAKVGSRIRVLPNDDSKLYEGTG
ncbi:Vacuolar inheritance and morphology protein [Exophiala sideris]|uniref:Vacuolar inheritance and morphology protein n=1 Tax=Exophiala sideris TaxID=1016849 RepID=A0ABR0J738_9EURO|nr:Vacuolar inheritance and morphology protein [Exophiala sideris]KAK5058075.1 Vacuolar inheritance and morphology protein [Exophiala sideris]KAK5182034.1 Vacuolar inheritance and morphology protein [Eurotiomycetes sp. CCFEE 6388]